MPLSPRELNFFPSCYSFTYQAIQMLSWGSLPMLHHRRWTDVKTPQSTFWETELIQEPWFVSPDLHAHPYLFTHALNAKGPAVIYRENHLLKLMHPICFPQTTPFASLSLSAASNFGADQKTLFIWTYPRTELDQKGMPTKPVKGLEGLEDCFLLWLHPELFVACGKT